MNIFNKPNFLLRLEGAIIFMLSITIYYNQGYNWTTFWSFILIPDTAFLAYLINSNIGATAYNITHSKLLPSLLAIFAISTHNVFLISLSVVWFAHVGIDRFLGYGLKYPKGFKYTHLGILGGSDNCDENYTTPSFCIKK